MEFVVGARVRGICPCRLCACACTCACACDGGVCLQELNK